MVPDSECRTPTLMVSAARAGRLMRPDAARAAQAALSAKRRFMSGSPGGSNQTGRRRFVSGGALQQGLCHALVLGDGAARGAGARAARSPSCTSVAPEIAPSWQVASFSCGQKRRCASPAKT